jgi:hypothetical protein
MHLVHCYNYVIILLTYMATYKTMSSVQLMLSIIDRISCSLLLFAGPSHPVMVEQYISLYKV